MVNSAPRTQDLIFTLYGDYFLDRPAPVWIGSLIELLGALGVSEQAVRSTVSRMARKGWLCSTRRGRNSYYSLTPRSLSLLKEGARQIFSPRKGAWRGCWFLVTYAFSDSQRRTRHRLRQRLAWLGFGQLTPGVWLSPHNRLPEVQELVAELDACHNVDCFEATYLNACDGATLAARCWDLEDLGRRYACFIDRFLPAFTVRTGDNLNGRASSAVHDFCERFWLIHEFRYFPFNDPYLPAEFLPDNWPGDFAATLFQRYHALLTENAGVFVDSVLAQVP